MVLFLTIVAAPLAPMLIMLFGVALFTGGAYASLYVGRRICAIFNPQSTGTPGYLCFTIGMTIILLLSALPYLGYLIALLAFMTGLGGLVQSYIKPKMGLPTADAAAKI